MDERLRDLERQAKAGDPDAQHAILVAEARITGTLPFPELLTQLAEQDALHDALHEADFELHTEWEEGFFEPWGLPTNTAKEFGAFAQDGTGGQFCLWLYPGRTLETAPVIVLGSEGEVAIVGNSLGEFLAILGTGYSTWSLQGKLDEEPENEPTEELLGWLKEQCGVEIPNAAESLAAARLAHPDLGMRIQEGRWAAEAESKREPLPVLEPVGALISELKAVADDPEDLYERIRHHDDPDFLEPLVAAIERCGPGEDEDYCSSYETWLKDTFLPNEYVPLLEASFGRAPGFFTFSFFSAFAGDPVALLEQSLTKDLPDELKDEIQERLDEERDAASSCESSAEGEDDEEDDEEEDELDVSELELAKGGVLDLTYECDQVGLKQVQDIAARFPDVRRIRCKNLAREAFAALDQLSSLEGVGVTVDFYDAEAERAFLHGLAPLGDKLVELEVSNLKTKDLEVVGRFTRLERLSIERSDIRDEGFRFLAGLERLQALKIGNAYVTGCGLEYLPKNQLLELDLSSTGGSDREGPRLTATTCDAIGRFTNLMKLELRSNHFDPGATAGLRNLANLKVLGCAYAGLRDEALSFLQGLTKLESLDLCGNPCGSGGLNHLRAPGLKSLSLNDTKVDDDALAAISELKNLTVLKVGSTRASDVGLAHLATLTGLESLEVGSRGVTDAGLAALSALTQLEELELSKDASVTEAGLDPLRSALGEGCHVSVSS